MNKHTPGPWYTKREGFSTVYVEARIGGGWIQEVSACGPTENGASEQEANARLIAAAPKLLEALQRIMDADCPLSGTPSHSELVEFWEYEKSQGRGEAEDRLFALAAIAEATGGAE